MARQYGLAFGLVRWRQVQATRLQAYLYNKEEKDKERGINGQHDEQSVVLPFLHLGSFLPSPASPLISLPWVVVLAILRILQCLSRLSCGVALCPVLSNLGDKLYQLYQALSDYDMVVLQLVSLF